MGLFVDAICDKVSWEYRANDFSILREWNHLTTENTIIPVCFSAKQCSIVFDMRQNSSNGKIIFAWVCWQYIYSFLQSSVSMAWNRAREVW